MKKIFLFLIFASTITFGYTQDDVSNATLLADKNIIVKQSKSADYRLDDTITRAEVSWIALKIMGVNLPAEYVCKKYFSDTIKNDWICRAMEIGADKWIISRSNNKARPQDTITRSEALAIIINASGMTFSERLSEVDNIADPGNTWQQKIYQKYKDAGIGISGMSYDRYMWKYFWYPNNVMKRWDLFFSIWALFSPDAQKRITCDKSQANYISIFDPYYQKQWTNCLYYKSSWFGDSSIKALYQWDAGSLEKIDDLFARDKSNVYRILQWWVISIRVEGSFEVLENNSEKVIIQEHDKLCISELNFSTMRSNWILHDGVTDLQCAGIPEGEI